MYSIFKKQFLITKRFLNSNPKISSWVLLFFAILVLLFQFLFVNRSLWLDEILLTQNFINRGFGELLKPLDNGQIAPIGYLFIVKTSVSIFGLSELSLRLPSFLAGCITLLTLRYYVQKKMDGAFQYLFFGITFLILSDYFVYYTSEVKQYIFDVMVTSLLITWSLLYSFKGKPNKKWIIGSLIGIMAAWLSNISFIPMMLCSAILLIRHIEEKGFNPKQIFTSITVVTTWFVSFSIVYVLFFYDHPTSANMMGYWKNVNGFPEPTITSFFEVINNLLYGLYSRFGRHHVKFMFIPITLIFCIACSIWKKNSTAILLFGIILIHFTISTLELYPFHDRLTLYWIIPMVYGIVLSLKSLNTEKYPRMMLYALITLSLWPSVEHFLRPIERTQVRDSMEYVIENSGGETPILALYDGSSSKILKFYIDFNEVNDDNIQYDWDINTHPEPNQNEAWYYISCWSPSYYGHSESIKNMGGHIIETKVFKGIILIHVAFSE